jgi:ParB-like chromosome segregation protein Spo0J
MITFSKDVPRLNFDNESVDSLVTSIESNGESHRKIVKELK